MANQQKQDFKGNALNNCPIFVICGTFSIQVRGKTGGKQVRKELGHYTDSEHGITRTKQRITRCTSMDKQVRSSIFKCMGWNDEQQNNNLT